MKSVHSLKKLGTMLIISGGAVFVISTIVTLSSLSSIYGMAGSSRCKSSDECDARLTKVSTTVHVARYAMYASIVIVAGGVLSIVLSDKQKSGKQ